MTSQKKMTYKSEEEEWRLRRLDSRELQGLINVKISEGGLVQYKLNLCYGGDCVNMERVALMGNWGNISDKIKGEIRAVLEALEFGNFVIKEAKNEKNTKMAHKEIF